MSVFWDMYPDKTDPRGRVRGAIAVSHPVSTVESATLGRLAAQVSSSAVSPHPTVSEHATESSLIAEHDNLQAKQTHVPGAEAAQNALEMQPGLPRMMKHWLAKRVRGQDQAIDISSEVIYQALATVPRRDRPLAVLLFLGARGVGKTALTQSLAEYLSANKYSPRFVELNMAQYRTEDTIRDFIKSLVAAMTAYPGGVHETGSQASPIVFVLDTIQKAHRKVLNIVLGIVKTGILNVGHGKHVNFKDAIICLQSSLELEEFASPESLDYVDEIIAFNTPRREARIDIVDLHLSPLTTWLKARQVTLHVSDDARQWLATEKFSAEYGVRHIVESIDDLTLDITLSVEALGRVRFDRCLSLTVIQGSIRYDIQPASAVTAAS